MQAVRGHVLCGVLLPSRASRRWRPARTPSTRHSRRPRWAGVPFILTAGKALQEKKVEVRIVFREAPCQVPELRGACRNELVVRVQPDERVYWRVANKVPGLEELQVEPRRMNLMYTHTEVQGMPDAYERLVLEVLRGDATNFVSCLLYTSPSPRDRG